MSVHGCEILISPCQNQFVFMKQLILSSVLISYEEDQDRLSHQVTFYETEVQKLHLEIEKQNSAQNGKNLFEIVILAITESIRCHLNFPEGIF